MNDNLAGSIASLIGIELERRLASVKHSMLPSEVKAFEQLLYELLREKAWPGRKEPL